MSRTAQEFEWLARRGSPVQTLDDALLVVRRAAAGQNARGWLASLPLGATALLFYYLERVEGLRTPRVAFAAALVLGFWFRFHMLALLAREFVHALRPSLPLSAATPPWQHVACSGSVTAIGLWFWAWPLMGLGRLSAFAVLALVPFLAVRGAVAPSHLARAACGDERGLAAFSRAVEDTRGARAAMLTVELLVSGGFWLLFANLYALGALLLLLGNAVLGLDVSFLAAFLSPDNEFVPLLLLAVTALVLEPLRAALSALAFAEARGRNEGADLHAAIDALAVARPPRSLSRALGNTTVVLVLAFACSAGAATAQDAPESQPQENARDQAVRSRAQHILARREFHEFDAAGANELHLSEWLERWFGGKSEPEALPAASSARFELKVPAWVVVIAALVLLGVVAAFVSAEARKAVAAAVPSPALSPSSLRPQPNPMSLLADAAALAQAGQYRDALRALYSATLVALDRAHVIRFEPSRTNGHYLRSMPAGTARQQFGAFTEAFESTWYGAAPANEADYQRARVLAESLFSALETKR